jgi:FkbM family methyltransferase
LNKGSIFDDEEKDNFSREKKLSSDIQKADTSYRIDKFKFKNNNMTIHNFIDDVGLSFVKDLSRVRRGDILDVGAYIGDSSLILSKYTDGTVYAFEPFQETYLELQENIKLNEVRNIVAVNKAAGDKSGTHRLYFAKRSNLSVSTFDPVKSLTNTDYESILIDTTTLDEFCSEYSLKVGAIKIDAEGAEKAVLRGALTIIRRDRPVLLVSIYHNIDDFMDIKPWIDELDLGYRYKISKPEGTTFVEETMLVCH